MERVFGEDDEVHGGEIASRLADHLHDPVRLRGELRGRVDDRELELDEADDDTVLRLVETTETVHGILSSCVIW